MGPKFPAIAERAINGNDDRHNLPDSNAGGSPRGGKGTLPIAPAQRGGFGQQGQRKTVNASMGGGRSGAGNPASRGGSAIGSMQPHARVPGHGGSPQKGNLNVERQFGKSGQSGVPGGNPTQPPPGAGNTSGRSYRLIAGRFKRAAMGAKASSGGSYGAPPVTSNT